MPCDTRRKRGQTIQQRAQEVRDVVAKVDRALIAGRVKMAVGPQGAVTFTGITAQERDDVTDACMYRRLMATGSPLARAAMQRAEQMAGRAVDRVQVAHGAHSHDGGHTWHSHKG